MTILLLVVIYIAFISLGLPDSLFGVAWPVIHTEMNLDEGFAAIYMIIVGAGTASISFIAGPLIRKLGTGWVTAVSILLTAVGLYGMGISHHIVFMIISAIAIGVGAGAVDTALNDFVSKHYKARHMSWLHCFWGVGVTISPLIMSVFLSGGGWRGGYQAMAIIQICLTAIMFLSLPLWKRVIALKKQDIKVELKPDSDIEAPKREKFNVFKVKGVVFAAVSLSLYCGMEYLVGLWGASFLVNIHMITPAIAARYIALYYGGIMVGRFIVGIFTLKLSNKTLIRSGIVFALLGAIMLVIPVEELTLPALLLIGMGFAPIFPCSIDSTKSRFDSRYSADIIGFQMGFGYIGAFIFQLGLGYLATRTTFMVIPYALCIMCLLLFIDVEFLNRITSNQKKL